MKSLAGHLRAIGWLIVAFVLVVPLSVSVIIAALAPRIVTPNYEASTDVPLSVLTGSHASYEASAYAADFDTALSGPSADQAAAEASGQPGKDVSKYLIAKHAGDTTYVTAVFSAPSEQGAAQGLRAGVGAALTQLTTHLRQRAEIDLTAADTARVQLLRNHAAVTTAPVGTAADAWQAARAADLAKASERISDAQAALANAQVTERSVAQVTTDLSISTATLSTRPDQIRMIGAGALSSLFLTVGILAFSKWFAARRRRPAPPDLGAPPGQGALRDHGGPGAGESAALEEGRLAERPGPPDPR